MLGRKLWMCVSIRTLLASVSLWGLLCLPWREEDGNSLGSPDELSRLATGLSDLNPRLFRKNVWYTARPFSVYTLAPRFPARAVTFTDANTRSLLASSDCCQKSACSTFGSASVNCSLHLCEHPSLQGGRSSYVRP